jgi:hypothetical protein
VHVSNIKRGDLLRMMSFYARGFGGLAGETVWAIADEDGDHDEACVGVDVFFGPEVAWDEHKANSDDEITRVSEHRLPNYVCVALAKWRLTGEKTSCR